MLLQDFPLSMKALLALAEKKHVTQANDEISPLLRDLSVLMTIVSYTAEKVTDNPVLYRELNTPLDFTRFLGNEIRGTGVKAELGYFSDCPADNEMRWLSLTLMTGARNYVLRIRGLDTDPVATLEYLVYELAWKSPARWAKLGSIRTTEMAVFFFQILLQSEIGRRFFPRGVDVSRPLFFWEDALGPIVEKAGPPDLKVVGN